MHISGAYEKAPQGVCWQRLWLVGWIWQTGVAVHCVVVAVDVKVEAVWRPVCLAVERPPQSGKLQGYGPFVVQGAGQSVLVYLMQFRPGRGGGMVTEGGLVPAVIGAPLIPGFPVSPGLIVSPDFRVSPGLIV
jgi:hypothetical protein